jgi:hypothetical protein
MPPTRHEPITAAICIKTLKNISEGNARFETEIFREEAYDKQNQQKQRNDYKTITPRAIDHIAGKTRKGKLSNSIHGVSKQIHFVAHSL